MQNVTLIFCEIRATSKSRLPRTRANNLCVMARGNHLEAEGICPCHETIELEVAVALNARVWGDATRVIGHIGIDDIAIKIFGEIKDEMIDV